jgi:hypothetical protein
MRKEDVADRFGWGVRSGRLAIPKSAIDCQIKQNDETDFEPYVEDVKAIETLDIKVTFDEPSLSN